MTLRCFHIILIFSMLFVAEYSDAQKHLEPFEDYQHCTTGFFEGYASQDTIYPAKFENTIEISYPFQYQWGFEQNLKFWILSDNGKFGCLSSTGEWLLDCIYDSLDYDSHSEQFIAKLNGKTGTFKKNKVIGFPFENDEIYHQDPINFSYYYYGQHYFKEFFVRKKGLLGVYSFDGKQLIEPAFDSIQVISLSGNYPDSLVKRFYIVEKNGLRGLYDKEGNPRIEPGYQTLESFYESQKVRNTILFRVTDTLGRFAVMDEYGNQLTSFSEFKYLGAITEWTNQQFHAAGFATQCVLKAKKERITNLTTGKSSDWYTRTLLVGDWVWAQSKKEWLLLDTNFDTLVRQIDPNQQLYYFNYEGELKAAEYTQNATEPYLPEVTNEDYSSINYTIPELFVLKRSTPQTKKERKDGDEVKSKYALLHVSTGTVSPVFYDKIIRLGDKGVYFYWCFQLPEDSSAYPVAIYDGMGKLLKSIQADPKLEDLISNRYLARRIKDLPYPFFSFQQSNGKYVVYGIDGWQPELLPFDDKVSEVRKWEDSTGYFRFTDSDNHYYYADLNGKPLLGGKHYWFSGYENSDADIIPLKGDKATIYVNKRLDVLFDSCQIVSYFSDNWVEKLDQSIHAFVIRNGFVYARVKDTFQLVDAALFEEPNSINYIAPSLYVDDSGRRLSDEEVKKVQKKQKRYFTRSAISLENNQLKVERFDENASGDIKTTERIIPDVLDYEALYNGIKIITTDKKEGYLDRDNCEWLLEPRYQYTAHTGHMGTQVFLARTSPDSKWFAVNGEGEPLTTPLFDTPVYFDNEKDWTYVLSGEKYGTINKKFEWLTEPNYYTTEYEGYSAFMLAEDHYAVIDRETGKSFRAPYDSVDVAMGSYVFLFNDSVQIISAKGTDLVPPMPVVEAVSTYNFLELIQFYEPQHFDTTKVEGGFIYSSDSDSFFRQLNNEIILENAANDLLVFKADEGKYERVSRMNERCLRYPLYASTHFYSERITGECYNQPDIYEGTNQRFSFRNFEIVNNELIQKYCIGDLLKEGAEYEARLNKLIEAKIQTNQIFGIACANLPAAVEELKRNFYFEGNNLCFLYYDLGETDGTIKFEFEEVKDLLKR